MVRRVIVDLMLSLFAMILMVAVVSSNKPGSQPKSKNFIVVSTVAKGNQEGHLTFVSPEFKDSPEVEVPSIQGFPEPDGRTTIIYTQFPAVPGKWRIQNKAGEEREVKLLTRSGIQTIKLEANGIREVQVLR